MTKYVSKCRFTTLIVADGEIHEIHPGQEISFNSDPGVGFLIPKNELKKVKKESLKLKKQKVKKDEYKTGEKVNGSATEA